MKGFLLRLIVKLYMSTFRQKVHITPEVTELADAGKKLVFFCWHNQLMVFLSQSSRFKAVTMISRSKDGDLFAPLVESFGHAVARASSSRGASAGLMEMLEYMEKGFHGAMAADGPKGPVYQAKPGALYLAKKADCIIVPVLCDCNRFFRFNSWDRFILPKPFAKIDIHLCEPIRITDSVEKDVVEKELAEVQSKIMELTRAYSKNII